MRPIRLDDIESILSLWTEPGVRRFLFDDQVISREQAETEITESIARFETLGCCGLWGATLLEDSQLIGFCGYRFFHEPPQLQLLYGFHPDNWGQGFATEAAQAMIRFGFERVGLDQIIACADAPNTASLRVMEKAGMFFDRRENVNGAGLVYYKLDRQRFKPDLSTYETIPITQWTESFPEMT